jgi:hypothetical protein
MDFLGGQQFSNDETVQDAFEKCLRVVEWKVYDEGIQQLVLIGFKNVLTSMTIMQRNNDMI